IEDARVNKACGRQVAGQRIAGKSPDEDFLARTGEDRGHLVQRLSHGECSEDREKRSGQNWQSHANHAKIATCAALLSRCKELIFQGLRANDRRWPMPDWRRPEPVWLIISTCLRAVFPQRNRGPFRRYGRSPGPRG